MNPLFERQDEPDTTEQVSMPTGPLLEQVPLKQQELEAELHTLLPVTETTERSVMLVITKCRQVETELYQERRSITDPINTQIETITAPYSKAINLFAGIRKRVDDGFQVFRQEQSRQRAIAQQEANAKAAADRAKKEQEAEDARKAADEERAKGNEVAATKLEGKAQRAELVAANVAPEVIPEQPKTTTLYDGSKVTTRTVLDFTYANGQPRGHDYYRDDGRFKDLPDEFFLLDEAKVAKQVKAGRKINGLSIFDKQTTVSRKAS